MIHNNHYHINSIEQAAVGLASPYLNEQIKQRILLEMEV